MRKREKRQVLKLLANARKLINKRSRWTQFHEVDIGSDDGETKYCLVGAINRTYYDMKCNEFVRMAAINYMRLIVNNHWLTTWNDNRKRTHRQVLGALDRTINKLKKELISE